jgi:peptidoglycan/LPS O-acetylase OafA/YrhL
MQRLRCLDGLRGLLAVYVLLGHMMPFVALPDRVGWLASLMSHGMAGVDMFFVLSGLVIMQSLRSFDFHAGPFLIARAARIFPAFLVVFAFAAGVQLLTAPFDGMPWVPADGTAREIWSAGGWPEHWWAHILAHLTMTHGLFPAGQLPFVWVSFLGAAWSLSAEWQFYAMITVLAYRFGRGPGGEARLAAIFLAIALVGAAWQVLAPPDLLFSRAFMPNKAHYFALGIISAAEVRDDSRSNELRYLAVLICTFVLCRFGGGNEKLIAPFAWTLCLAVQLRSTVPGLHLASRILASRPLIWLGGISYSVYLVNEPVQKLLGSVLVPAVAQNALLFDILWVPGAILIPIGLAWWLHEEVEVPAIAYGRGLAHRAMAPAAPPPRAPDGAPTPSEPLFALLRLY